MITKQTVLRGAENAVKVVGKLLKYIIPAIFLIKVLEHSGLLVKIADVFAPYMAYMGLPGESAIVFLLGQVTIYSGIAAIATLDLTVKQITIMSAFLSICHVLIIETAVVGESGANGFLNAAFRFSAAVLTCLILNIVIPGV